MRILRLCLAVFASLVISAAPALAASISIAWDANTEADLAGYVVLYGTASGQYTHSVDVGKTTAWTLTSAVEGTTYYFRVQAYTTDGLKSDPSSEVSGTSATGAGPATPGTETPNPALSRPVMSVDLPRANSSVQPDFTVAGWAADLGATATAGVDAVHVWAYPNPGSGQPAVFLGAAAIGYSRPDVASAFAAPRMAASGFGLAVANLAPGVYDLVVFAHSRVAAAFNNTQVVRVTVQPRATRPMMVIDYPAANGTVSGPFVIGGWALDLAAASGSGVDTIHIWAYPDAPGAAPIFVGVATMAVARPDVGAAFGAQFSTAGYDVVGQLPPGHYRIAVFAHSAIAGTFNNTLVVPVTVK